MQQLREASPDCEGPKYLVRDNDGNFGRHFAAVADCSGIEVVRIPKDRSGAAAEGVRMPAEGRARRGCGGRPAAPYPLRSRSAAFSPIMMHAALVLPPTTDGMIAASATRSPSIPRTRSAGSTTARSSLPIRQVPTGW